MRLAIYELAVIAALSAVGTVIPQNKAIEYYMENYPDVDGARVFGFVTWRLIGLFQFDHVYVAPYFLGLLALLGASLAACTTTRQWPMLRVARRSALCPTPNISSTSMKLGRGDGAQIGEDVCFCWCSLCHRQLQ